MNTAHWHLVLNHFPIIGTMIGLLVMTTGLFYKSQQIKNVGMGLVVVMSLLAIPAFLTGEGAEEAVEGLPGVSEALMEEHEETAETAIWFMEIAGVFSLAGLLLSWKRMTASNAVFYLALTLTIATTGLMAYTGYLGGQIRHSEIRSGAAGSSQAGETGGAIPADAAGEEEEEEDD